MSDRDSAATGVAGLAGGGGGIRGWWWRCWLGLVEVAVGYKGTVDDGETVGSPWPAVLCWLGLRLGPRFSLGVVIPCWNERKIVVIH